MRQNPQKMSAMGGGKVFEWKRLGDLALAELIVSPERALEIQARLYPEDEMMGRPGIIHNRQPGEKQSKSRSPVRDEPTEIEVNSWRVTPPEFEGKESELIEEMEGAA